MDLKVRESSAFHMKIKDWPAAERPREKLLREGPRALSEAELVALLIGSGTSGGVTAVDIAKRLLAEHGGLRGLITKNPAELRRMRGVGDARAARVLAALEIGRRMSDATAPGRVKIKSPEDVFRALGAAFHGLRHEVFKVLLLDSGSRRIRECTVSQGTLNASLVHPREVFKAAIDHVAASVVLAHNHPSGDPSPSAEDRVVTDRLVEAGRIVGIPVLDHVVFAGDRFISFAAEGWIKPQS